MQDDEHSSLNRFYDSLWERAEDAFVNRSINIDHHLNNKNKDRRRGLSLILRPHSSAVHKIDALVDELRRLEPKQYYYTSQDYHVTILSLLTASTNYKCISEQIESYKRAISLAIAGLSDFSIRFRGITATSDAVMIQGFPEDNALNQLRSRILEKLKANRISIRQRYLPQAAHLTVMRYRQPIANGPAFADKLRSLRTQYFGAIKIGKIYLVENDWYMSKDKLNLIRIYAL